MTTPAIPPSTTTSLLQRVPVLLTLRGRLSMSLLIAVAVAVAAGTGAHLVEVSERLERDLHDQATRVVGAVRTDLESTATALDEELIAAADPRSGIARFLGASRVETRFLGAQGRLVSGRLEVLKVLARDGTILTSGHWPASFGALDPLIAAYSSNVDRLPRVVDEATPKGSAPALERWTTLRMGGRELIVVAGRFLDAPALERLRARTGADLLALCPPTTYKTGAGLSSIASPRRVESGRGERCLVAQAPRLKTTNFFPQGRNEELRLDVIDVGGLSLYVGLDRSGIETIRSGIIRRAVIIGIVSVLFAVAIGALVARRLVRPIEELADAAARVARGDLHVRVDDPQAGGEVQALVLAFNQMAMELEAGQKRLLQTERVAAWQEIARGLAHELKNPLTPILSAMDVIRRARQLGRSDFDAILQEQAQAVVEEVMRLKELADAFARFARLPEKRPEPLKLDELLDNALALYASGVALTREWPATELIVVADRTQLMTVIGNLIKNAVEAMEGLPADARRLGVTIIDEPGFLTVHIDDNGPGISPEIRERLFTPYVTTKGSRGTGLGLALSHRIVMEHEGTIEGGVSPWGGARFSVRLPHHARIAPTTTTSPTN
jgi:two-component system nitrogen regulation sensor histidine kinase NtrY